MPRTEYSTEYPNECPVNEIKKLQCYLRGEGDKWTALQAAWFVEGYFLGRYMNEQSPTAAVGDEGPLPFIAGCHQSVKKISRDSLLQFFDHAIKTNDPANQDVGASFSRGNKGHNLLLMVAAASRIKSMLLAVPDEPPFPADDGE